MEQKCDICGQPTNDSNSTECNWCGTRFHLALTMEAKTSECGRIHCGQEYLLYMCNTCVKELDPDESLLATSNRVGQTDQPG